MGGDHCGATEAAAGDWRNIVVMDNGTATITEAVIRYGGAGLYPTNIRNFGGTLTLASTTVSNSYNYGLWTSDSDAVNTCTSGCIFEDNWTSVYQTDGDVDIRYSTIQDNGFYGVFSNTNVGGDLTLVGNTFSNNNWYEPETYQAGAVSVSYGSNLVFTHSDNATSTGDGIQGILVTGAMDTSQSWTADALPYVVRSTGLGIESGTTLTIDPGTIVKFATTTSYIAATGTIAAIGATASPIYFTSLRDDIGGDTNADASSTTASHGDWKRILIPSGGVGTFSDAIIRYGGHGSSTALDANLVNLGGTLDVASSTIASSTLYGILHWSTAGNTNVASSTFENNGHYALVTTQNSLFSEAVFNFWGATSGPYIASNPIAYLGEEVYDANSVVTYAPWDPKANFVTGCDSVDGSQEIHWGGDPEDFGDDFAEAIYKWNLLGGVYIEHETNPFEWNLTVSVIDDPDEEWQGWYSCVWDTIEFNSAYVTASTSEAVNTALHELGHSLALDHHDLWWNVMYRSESTQTVLGWQDLVDYQFYW